MQCDTCAEKFLSILPSKERSQLIASWNFNSLIITIRFIVLELDRNIKAAYSYIYNKLFRWWSVESWLRFQRKLQRSQVTLQIDSFALSCDKLKKRYYFIRVLGFIYDLIISGIEADVEEKNFLNLLNTLDAIGKISYEALFGHTRCHSSLVHFHK